MKAAAAESGRTDLPAGSLTMTAVAFESVRREWAEAIEKLPAELAVASSPEYLAEVPRWFPAAQI